MEEEARQRAVLHGCTEWPVQPACWPPLQFMHTCSFSTPSTPWSRTLQPGPRWGVQQAAESLRLCKPQRSRSADSWGGQAPATGRLGPGCKQTCGDDAAPKPAGAHRARPHSSSIMNVLGHTLLQFLRRKERNTCRGEPLESRWSELAYVMSAGEAKASRWVELTCSRCR